jgi:hypothetical protein
MSRYFHAAKAVSTQHTNNIHERTDGCSFSANAWSHTKTKDFKYEIANLPGFVWVGSYRWLVLRAEASAESRLHSRKEQNSFLLKILPGVLSWPLTNTQCQGYEWYDIIYTYNSNWVDARWQQYITHLHTNNTHNTEKGKLESAGRAPSLRVIPLHLPYNWKKARKYLS